MPNNKFDSKSFNAEAFKYMVARVPNLNMNEIKKSRALAANPDIQEVFSGQNGTAYARLAMRGLIDGDAVNYDGSTDITATSTKTFEQGVVVVGRAKAWKERDFSYDVTGGVDFMANISEQVAQYKDELDEATILSILKGIFAMSTTDAKNKEFVEKHTTTVSGAMTATTLNTAANKACGANKKKFTLVFCHSDVSTGLENLNLIERLKYTDKDGIQRDLELGTWNGKLVIVTDQMPVSEGYFDADANTTGALKIVASGTPADGEILLSKVTPYFGSKTLAANDYVVAGVQYTTYAMGNGAFSYEDIGVKVPYYAFFPTVDEAKLMGHEIVRRFEAAGIRVNKRKCKVIPLTKPFRFCKARFTLTETGKIKVNGSRDGVKRARRKLKLFHREFKEGKRTFFDIEQYMECQSAYYRNFNDHGRLLRLRRLYHAIFFGGGQCLESSKPGPVSA